MTSLVIALVCILASVPSCTKEKRPVDPVEFVRYTKDLSLHSSILNATIKYSVYLPEKYAEDTTARYGVVYLLHGYGDDNNSWNDEYLRISSVINYLEGEGKISPMIYVMPQGFNTYYVNRYSGSYNYMDMFVEELVPAVDKTLRTIADRDHRAVAGYSMGGYGAMILPSKHPELFSVSIPLSMSFRTDSQYMTESAGGWDSQWGYIFGGDGSVGKNRLTAYYKEYNPFYYFNSSSASSFSRVHYYLDCGDDEEQLLIANDTLHVLMRTLGIEHEFRVRNGAHTSDYWKTAMSNALPFVDCCFNGTDFPDEVTVDVASDKREVTVISAGSEGESVSADLILPTGFDRASAYPSLYLFYDSSEPDFYKKAVTLLDKGGVLSKCVLVACDADEMISKGVSAEDVTLAAEKEFSRTGDRTGLGCLDGGRLLYDASLSGDFPSVFMIEAALDEEVADPGQNTFYYFSFSDKSDFAFGADTLYRRCKRDGTEYQYRVYNGIESSNSMLYGLEEMIPSIKTKINK